MSARTLRADADRRITVRYGDSTIIATQLSRSGIGPNREGTDFRWMEPSIVLLKEKEVMSMNQNAPAQGGQKLQSHIEGFFDQALRSDTQRIEYKPRFIVQLLEMPSERRQNELREMSK